MPVTDRFFIFNVLYTVAYLNPQGLPFAFRNIQVNTVHNTEVHYTWPQYTSLLFFSLKVLLSFSHPALPCRYQSLHQDHHQPSLVLMWQPIRLARPTISGPIWGPGISPQHVMRKMRLNLKLGLTGGLAKEPESSLPQLD